MKLCIYKYKNNLNSIIRFLNIFENELKFFQKFYFIYKLLNL